MVRLYPLRLQPLKFHDARVAVVPRHQEILVVGALVEDFYVVKHIVRASEEYYF